MECGTGLETNAIFDQNVFAWFRHQSSPDQDHQVHELQTSSPDQSMNFSQTLELLCGYQFPSKVPRQRLHR